MKNKKTIFILLPLVLFVWGIIGYKIYSNFSDKGNPIQVVEQKESQTTSMKTDSMTLLLNYRDPFFKKNKPKKTITTNSQFTTKKTPIPQPSITVTWPEIIYSGMIKNKSSNKTLGLLIVNKSSVIVKEGEEISGMKVIKVHKDSILLALNKNIKTFKK